MFRFFNETIEISVKISLFVYRPASYNFTLFYRSLSRNFKYICHLIVLKLHHEDSNSKWVNQIWDRKHLDNDKELCVLKIRLKIYRQTSRSASSMLLNIKIARQGSMKIVFRIFLYLSIQYILLSICLWLGSNFAQKY